MNFAELPRHELWRASYRARRYARHLTQVELNRRVRDIFLNLLRLTPAAKIGLPPISPESSRWMELWTHVLEEMQLRHGPYPAGFTRDVLNSDPIPDLAGELADKAAAALGPRASAHHEIFARFGKREHMEALYHRGSLRIQSANFFKAPGHNIAVRDDELTVPMSFALSREEIVRLVRNPQDVPAGPLEHRIDVHFSFPTDYWLYCLTTSLEPRLIVDFDAHACVIIREQNEFRNRLLRSAAAKLPEAALREGAAIYVDPLLPNSADVFVPLAKHFAYAYQQEYRFVWLPRSPAQNLEPVDIEIGPLNDIAELVVV
jgi:hypothetical protein